MRWKAKRIPSPSEWRPSFCFLPRKVENTWVWLEKVEMNYGWNRPYNRRYYRLPRRRIK